MPHDFTAYVARPHSCSSCGITDTRPQPPVLSGELQPENGGCCLDDPHQDARPPSVQSNAPTHVWHRFRHD
eukprot:4403037-Amphidinium_carterae.2